MHEYDGDPINSVVLDCFDKVFNYQPRPFQLQTLQTMLRMKQSTRFPIRPVILVQGTGGGKSSVYQSFGIIKGGISLIIQTTLSLSSDQKVKIINIGKKYKNVKALQLDAIKGASNIKKVCNILRTLPTQTNKTVFLFSLPEALCQPHWANLVAELIECRNLHQICVDEVHLFVQFAVTFRPSFIRLREILFQKVLINRPTNNNCTTNTTDQNSETTVNVIFMTATYNQNLHKYLKRITGYTMLCDTFIWSSNFNCRHISIHCNATTHKMKYFKRQIKAILQNDVRKKGIIYSNSAKSVEQICDQLDSWGNEPESFDGDTMMIVGNLESEWKYVCTKKFTEEVENAESIVKDGIEYYPRLLAATAGCIGAGLDSPEVRLVLREGVPPSVLDFIQEMGWCGRGVHNGMKMNGHYCLTFTFLKHGDLSSFVLLSWSLTYKPYLPRPRPCRTSTVSIGVTTLSK